MSLSHPGQSKIITQSCQTFAIPDGETHHGQMADRGDDSRSNDIYSMSGPSYSEAIAVNIRLLIADDHELIRDGLRLTFDGTDVDVVAEAANGQEAFDQLDQHDIDVALVDISMPEADGFRFLQLVETSGKRLPVVMHSIHDRYIPRSRELGASGYVVKGQEKDVLLNAVRTVHSGGEFWKSDV